MLVISRLPRAAGPMAFPPDRAPLSRSASRRRPISSASGRGAAGSAAWRSSSIVAMVRSVPGPSWSGRPPNRVEHEPKERSELRDPQGDARDDVDEAAGRSRDDQLAKELDLERIRSD